MKYRKSVFIVVYKKVRGKVLYLVLKRKLHWQGWEFPKGGVRRFEFRKSAVRREIKEEAGLEIAPRTIRSYKVRGRFRYGRKLADRKGFVGQDYSLYSAEVRGKVSLKNNKDSEHSDFKWLEFSDAVKKLTWKNQRECLRIVSRKIIKG